MDDDKELTAMSAITKALADMPPDAIARIVRWTAARFGVAIEQYSQDSATKLRPRSRTIDAPGEFESPADLYDAANPDGDAEKALVAGYWFQEVQGAQDLDSQQINAALKDMGHGIGNITRAISTLQTAKPRLVLQIRKSGSTKQARKTFKLTGEGVKRVRSMLSRKSSPDTETDRE